MKYKFLALASLIVVTTSGYALAQSSPPNKAQPSEVTTSKDGMTTTGMVRQNNSAAPAATTGAAPTDPNKVESPSAMSPSNAEKDNKNKGN